jgi:hypothetical protein
MCDSSRPEEDGAVLQDLSVLETDFSAPPADVVTAPDPSSVAEVHVKTEEQQTREKMDQVMTRLVRKEVIFIESATGIRASLETIDKVESQNFARKCLSEVLDIFVQLKVTGLSDATWSGLVRKWGESTTDQAEHWKQVLLAYALARMHSVCTPPPLSPPLPPPRTSSHALVRTLFTPLFFIHSTPTLSRMQAFYDVLVDCSKICAIFLSWDPPSPDLLSVLPQLLDYELPLFSNKMKDGHGHVSGASHIRRGVMEAFKQGAGFEGLLRLLRKNVEEQEQQVQELAKKREEEEAAGAGAKEWLLPQSDLDGWLRATALILHPFVLCRYSSFLSLQARLDAVQMAMRQLDLTQLAELRLQESSLTAVLERLLDMLDTSPNEIFRSDETSRHRGQGTQEEEKLEERRPEAMNQDDEDSVDGADDNEVGGIIYQEEDGADDEHADESTAGSQEDREIEDKLAGLKEDVIQLWRDTCLNAFNSEQFKLRLFGVTQLLPIVKSSSMPPAEEWLKEERIIEGIFGARLHPEIVSRSQQFIELLVERQILTKDDLGVIWRSAVGGAHHGYGEVQLVLAEITSAKELGTDLLLTIFEMVTGAIEAATAACAMEYCNSKKSRVGGGLTRASSASSSVDGTGPGSPGGTTASSAMGGGGSAGGEAALVSSAANVSVLLSDASKVYNSPNHL